METGERMVDRGESEVRGPAGWFQPTHLTTRKSHSPKNPLFLTRKKKQSKKNHPFCHFWKVNLAGFYKIGSALSPSQHVKLHSKNFVETVFLSYMGLLNVNIDGGQLLEHLRCIKYQLHFIPHVIMES